MSYTEYYMPEVRELSTESLRYTIDDCKAAIRAMPDNEKVGHYTDLVLACSEELGRRAHPNCPGCGAKNPDFTFGGAKVCHSCYVVVCNLASAGLVDSDNI